MLLNFRLSSTTVPGHPVRSTQEQQTQADHAGQEVAICDGHAARHVSIELALLEGHPEMKIFGYDHNKDHVLAWADALYSHAAASKFMSGIAFHWYAGGGFDAMERIHEQHPDTIKEDVEAGQEHEKNNVEKKKQKK